MNINFLFLSISPSLPLFFSSLLPLSSSSLPLFLSLSFSSSLLLFLSPSLPLSSSSLLSLQARGYSTMQGVTNPYECELGGRVLVGTSGQNVENVMRCSTLQEPLEILQKLCEWGHLAPTTPDTLCKSPYIFFYFLFIYLRDDKNSLK